MVDALLDAAARVLMREGYANATTNAVAATAGVSIGSLYQYFPNKEALAAALHERHARQMHALMQRILDDPAPRTLEQTVRELVHASVEAHRLQPKLHQVLEQEVPYLDRFEDEAAIDRAIHGMLAKMARERRRELKVRDLDLAAFVVGEMVHALIHAAVIEPPSGLHYADIAEETVHAVVAYLTRAR